MSAFGNCTLQTCSIESSIFEYRPSLPINALFIALFGVSGFIHAFQGVWFRQWSFSILMVIGCICEMIGYGGRIIMYSDPWSFNGFIMQIVCITIAPVFMTAGIYVTLYKSVMRLSPASALFKPVLYFQIFIPCDIISLVLQAVGGAMSTQSNGSSQKGVDIGLAGLSFQVATLFVFIVLAVQYGLQYRKDVKSQKVQGTALDGRFKFCLVFLSLATILIFVRCAYRIYELSDGYGGVAIHDQGLFIALESCMIIVATFALNIGHPGLVFSSDAPATAGFEKESQGYSSEEVRV